ncbi:MAG: Eco57I restriction-modification methylase domain-containing protein [Bacteroidales bacterium]
MNFESSLRAKLIYIFRINAETHKGCLKIGEATANDDEELFGLKPNSSALNKAAKNRIDQYTQTAGINYDLLYTELAIYTAKGRIRCINDSEVHKVLTRSGITKKEFFVNKQPNEWFVTDLETVKNAIKAAKEGRKSLTNAEVSTDMDPIVFRPEQKDAIEKTIKQFKKSNQFLWNAKMRFGKTLSALEVVKRMGFKRTLILTHRPVVDFGWFDDFGKIFYDTPDYYYGSKNNGETFHTLEYHASTKNNKYIYFASMQDLRGSEKVGGNFNKNDHVFSTAWDLIIVDEAHEGMKTDLGVSVMTELIKANTKVLRLSGTPFNLFDDHKEDEIFTWDYVMEQRAKQEWELYHFGDPNPYASLPRLNIFTYNLGESLAAYSDSELAFNFKEFFRIDESGEFIHHKDVVAFVNLLCKKDAQSKYPFSTDKYRDNFRHTLWMIPGVKEAKALSSLLQSHPVFCNFKIVNVAGEGDEETNYSDALKAVKDAMTDSPEDAYTITLSCGKLTTGVSVKPWTAVLMLSGSYNTSAAGYMQTIFRVQTPAVIGGKTKEECFVFDFAPDRTLKVIAETAKISAKAGKTSDNDRTIMGDFLNFCPIIGINGSEMRQYDTGQMLEQLKKVYVERVVRNGFEDGCLYNDNLMKLDDVELNEFDQLKKIIGATRAMPKTGDIDLNRQGFTDEEHEQLEAAEKKKRKKEELSEEDKRLIEEKAKKRKNKETAISVLRGISIRMPLMIYGAELKDETQTIDINNFTSLIDNQSWEEFMPKGVTKQKFNGLKKYYDPDIFSAAGKRIREMAKSTDTLTVEERIERITAIFATFRNPDKETVLTPWRVVNMHIGDCMGGHVFFDEKYENTLSAPRYVNHGEVTDQVFNSNSRILEINSKSGLYPLYMAYSIYRNRLTSLSEKEQNNKEICLGIWDKVLKENIFVLCKTPMAKSITKRTLRGFRDAKVNTRHFQDLTNQITNKPDNFLSKVKDGKGYWKVNNESNMKFNAIVGNPPYQMMDGGGNGSSSIPIYNKFVDISRNIKPNFISMIMPSKWYSGGKGLDVFRESMLNDKRIRCLFDYNDSRDCFDGVDIAGGVCYFLWDIKYNDNCSVYNCTKTTKTSSVRALNQFESFIREHESIDIIDKVNDNTDITFSSIVYSRRPFGLSSDAKGRMDAFDKCVEVFGSKGYFYIEQSLITSNKSLIDKWKVVMSKTSSEHAGQSDKDGKKRVVSRIEVLGPNTVCTESYLLLSIFDSKAEANNLKAYVKTSFFRFLLSTILLTQNISKDKFKFVPLQDFTTKSDIDWSKSIEEIDQQLYAKYSLTEEEIAFIESTIKPMV